MKPKNFTQKQVKLLIRLGFRTYFPDELDPGYCQFILQIREHRLLGNLRVVVDDEYVNVWCNEHKNGMVPGQEVLIASREYSMTALEKILKAVEYGMLKPVKQNECHDIEFDFRERDIVLLWQNGNVSQIERDKGLIKVIQAIQNYDYVGAELRKIKQNKYPDIEFDFRKKNVVMLKQGQDGDVIQIERNVAALKVLRALGNEFVRPKYSNEDQ